MKDRVGSSIKKCVRTLNMSDDYTNRGKHISRTTVRRYVRSQPWGRIARKLVIKPLLTKQNVTDRLSFALNVQIEGYCDDGRHGRALRENVLWTDESPIELNPIPNKQNTRVRTSDEMIPVFGIPKRSLKIMVAGGMTAKSVTDLHILEPKATINGRYYENQILPNYLNALNDPKLIANKNKATFMQDSAPPHNTKSVIKKIEDNFPMTWTKGVWPGNSPDLNVIEHVWNVLRESVFIEPKPKTRDQLMTRVREKWFSLTPEYLSNLVHSFPNRITETINNEDGNTNY